LSLCIGETILQIIMVTQVVDQFSVVGGRKAVLEASASKQLQPTSQQDLSFEPITEVRIDRFPHI
jgi:hypothetical protein